MRTSITRQELCDFITLLGADPARVNTIYATPFKLTVDQNRLDEDGYKVADSDGFPIEESYEIAVEGGWNDRETVEVTSHTSSKPEYI